MHCAATNVLTMSVSCRIVEVDCLQSSRQLVCSIRLLIPRDFVLPTDGLDYSMGKNHVDVALLPIHFSAILLLFAVSLFELLVAGFLRLGRTFALLADLGSWPGLQDHLSELVKGQFPIHSLRSMFLCCY